MLRRGGENKGDLAGAKGLEAEGEPLVPAVGALLVVPHQGVAQVGHVRPSLVGAAGVEGHLQQADAVFGAQHLVRQSLSCTRKPLSP